MSAPRARRKRTHSRSSPVIRPVSRLRQRNLVSRSASRLRKGRTARSSTNTSRWRREKVSAVELGRTAWSPQASRGSMQRNILGGGIKDRPNDGSGTGLALSISIEYAERRRACHRPLPPNLCPAWCHAPIGPPVLGADQPRAPLAGYVSNASSPMPTTTGLGPPKIDERSGRDVEDGRRPLKALPAGRSLRPV
jgi:hypothetical protein